MLKEYSEEEIVNVASYQDGVERFEVRSADYIIQKHSTLLDYQHQLGSSVINDLFKFTCIRNPWDRMISFYFSPHRGTVRWDRDEFIALVKAVKPTTDFISLNENGKAGQKCFANMDCYIRFEELDKGFEKICERISIPFTPLLRRNLSIRQHYSHYYDMELEELVRTQYQEEITFFKHEFE